MSQSVTFDLDCTLCPRLSQFLGEVRQQYPSYHALPVEPFGVKNPDLLVVGLAPGMHGANASGRPFTGDYAGILLYETLYEFGFSNTPVSESRDDGLRLKRCRITNAVKCLPPQNKPTGEEIATCNRYLQVELETLKPKAGVIVLGRIAHNAVLKALGLKQSEYAFDHGAVHRPAGKPWFIDSYHCSRYNTQTGRLTRDMFRRVFEIASRELGR